MGIALQLRDDTLEGDLLRSGGPGSGRILDDEGLTTMVTIALFSDAPARDGDGVPEGERRGWWADAYREDPSENPLGSRLWMLKRAKQTTETLRKAEDFALEALEFMTRPSLGIARSVEAAASWLRSGILLLETAITRPDGRRWHHKWEAQLGAH